MSLPAAGGNPYTGYLADLHDTLYQSPPSSFRPRIIVLCTVCVYGMLVSLLYYRSLRSQYSTKSREGGRLGVGAEQFQVGVGGFQPESIGGRQPPRFWIARRVDDYITLNLHAIIPFGGCFACACMLVYSYCEYVVLAENRHIGPINTFRSFMWLSVTLEGYFVTCASTQAYVVVARKSERMNRTAGRWSFIPPPRAFNIAFITLTTAMAGSMIGSDIAFAVVWSRAWRAITGLRVALEGYEASWSGGVDVAALLDLNARKLDVTEQVARTVPYQHAVVGSLIVCAMLIALLNIGSIALLLLLRRQIRASLARRSRLAVFNLEPERPSALTFNRRDIAILASIHTQSPRLEEGSTSPPVSPTTPSGEKFTIQVQPPDDEQQQQEQHITARLSLPFLPRLGRRKSSEATLTDPSPNGSTPNSLSAGWGAWKEKFSPGNIGEMFVPASPAMPIDLGGRDTLLNLKRAERDLMVSVVLVVAMGLMFGAENIWNYVYVLPNDVSWPAVEFSYFFCPWAFTTIYSTGCTILVVSSHIATVRQRRRQRAMSVVTDQPPKPSEAPIGAVGLETFLARGGEGETMGMGIEFGESVRIPRPPLIRFPSADQVSVQPGWGQM